MAVVMVRICSIMGRSLGVNWSVALVLLCPGSPLRDWLKLFLSLRAPFQLISSVIIAKMVADG